MRVRLLVMAVVVGVFMGTLMVSAQEPGSRAIGEVQAKACPMTIEIDDAAATLMDRQNIYFSGNYFLFQDDDEKRIGVRDREKPNRRVSLKGDLETGKIYFTVVQCNGVELRYLVIGGRWLGQIQVP